MTPTDQDRQDALRRRRNLAWHRAYTAARRKALRDGADPADANGAGRQAAHAARAEFDATHGVTA